MNQIAVTRDPPSVAIDGDIKTNELRIIEALQKCSNCTELIKKVLKGGHVNLSMDDDWEAMELLIDTDRHTYLYRWVL